MQSKIKHTLTLAATALFVTACGGGSGGSGGDSDAVVQETPLAVIAANATSSLNITQAKDISLQSTVVSSDDKAAYITAVAPLNSFTSDNCSSNYESLDLNVESTEVGVCAYQYTVALAEDSSVTSTAMSFSSVQGLNGGSSISLTPISLALEMGELATVDLQTQLGSDFPSAAELDEDSIIILGDESTVATADSTNDQISITAGSVAGHTRVYYTMTDEDAGIVEQGVIDIAVNDTINNAPTADDFQVEGTVQSDADITIDVADHIDDVNGDELRLVKVLTVNANAYILDDSDPDFTNYTSFEFNGMGLLGERVITYVVEDQMGGYAVGNVTLNLTGGTGAVEVSWSDITITDSTISHDITFTAPLSTEFANVLKVEYSAEYTEDGVTGPDGYKITLMNYKEAEEFCEYKSARLPTPRELALLKSKEGNTASSNLYDNQSWPIGNAYWSALSASETESQVYDFYNRSAGVMDNDDATTAYVTCVLLDDVVQDFNMERLSADSRLDTVTNYSTTVTDPEGAAAAYKQVYISTKNQNGTFSTDTETGALSLALKTDVDGNISFSYTESVDENELIVSQFSSTELNTIYKTDDEFRTTEINVHDPALWSRKALLGGGDLVTDFTDGLTLFNISANSTETTNLYINPINALEWQVYFVVESPSTNLGNYSVFVTQYASTAQSGWKNEFVNGNEIPGAPSESYGSDQSMSFFVRRYGASKAGVGYNVTDYTDYTVATTYQNIFQNEKVYYWLERYIDDTGVPYISFKFGTSPDYDDATQYRKISLNNVLGFNPFSDFYLGFGGQSNQSSATVTDIKISTYE